MSTLATRFAALRQQVSEKRSPAAISPRRLTPRSQASTQQRSSTAEEDDDLEFPPLGALIPTTSANANIGQRRRRDSEDDNDASAIIQARQAKLDHDRAFAKERMKYYSVTDIQTEMDITAFSATDTDQKLIEVRIIQEVEIRTLKAAIVAMSSQAKGTNTKLFNSVMAVILSPRIPLYVTGVYSALLQVAKKTPLLLGLPPGFDSSASTWHDTAKNISDHLIGGRSTLRQKLQSDIDGLKPSKAKGRKRSGRMALARLATELFGKQGPVSTDALGRAALLRTLYRDYLIAAKSPQNPKMRKRPSVGNLSEVDGISGDSEETGTEVDNELGQDGETGSSGDPSQSDKSNDGAPKWGPNSFWNYVDYSILELHKTIADSTQSQVERAQLYDSFITDTIQNDLKEFPASGTIEEDLELRTAGFSEADERPEYLVQLESAVFESLKLI